VYIKKRKKENQSHPSVTENVLAAGKISCHMLAFGATQRIFVEIQVIILWYKNLGLEAS
jgi:hypothetical protein